MATLGVMRRRRKDTTSAALAGAASAAAAEVEASLVVPPDPGAAAFFDVDNTMMQGASIYHFARGLAARDFFTWRDLAQFAMKQVSFRIKGVEDPAHMEEAKEAALAFVAGHKVEEVVTLGEEIYDDLMADRIWSGTRALAQLHLDSGQRVWLVPRPPPPGPGPRCVAGHRRPRRARLTHRAPAGPDRRSRHRRREPRRHLHRTTR